MGMTEEQKMTVKTLKKVRNIQRLIDGHSARKKIARTRAIVDDKCKLYELSAKKQENAIEQLRQAIEQTEEIIEKVNDEESKLMLQLYFIDCFTVEEIAEIMHYSLRQAWKKYAVAIEKITDVQKNA
jgi:DNA-directed RNA polymerase specialized sigma24 family protein